MTEKRSGQIEVICKQCGKKFLVKPSRIKYGHGKYCSKECGYAHLSDERSEKYPVTCQRCGKIFYKTKSVIDRGVKYCSRECHNPPAFKKCLNCKKEFRAQPPKQKYCSKKCADTSSEKKLKARKSFAKTQADPIKRKNWLEGIKRRSDSPQWRNSEHFKKGKDHPAYKGNNRKTDEAIHRQRYEYAQWRKKVFVRDNFTCQKCGTEDAEFHAHHIKPWADYPELRYEVNNGLTVCKECHETIHGKKFRPKSKVCLYCEQKYPASRNSRKFCSKKCFCEYRKHKQKRKHENIICPTCNKSFYPNKKTSTFCSISCARRYKR